MDRQIINFGVKHHKLQPRNHLIRSAHERALGALNEVKAQIRWMDVHMQKDQELLDHLSGKAVDKTAGRNRLGSGPWK